METLTVNSKTFELRQPLTFGQVRTIRHVMANFLDMNEKIKNATDVDMEKITHEVLNKSEQQDKIILEVFQKNLGMTQEQLDELGYLEAVVLFNEAFRASTEVKKKSEQPYI